MAGSNPAAKRKSSGKQSLSESLPQLVCPVHFTNTLPPIPFPPKFLPFPFNPDRFVEYKDTSLIRGYKYKLAFPNNGTIPVELLNPGKYATPVGARLDQTDKTLATMSHSMQEQQRRQLMEVQTSWLRKAEYLGPEVRFLGTNHSSDNKVRADGAEEAHLKDRDSQVRSILKSFEHAQEVPVHPTRPDLTPVEVMPLLPDQDLWLYPFAQVHFDTDPLSRDRRSALETDRLQQALVMAQRAEDQKDEFLSYFLPTRKCVAERKRARLEGNPDPATVFEYDKIREYSFDLRRREDTTDEMYFFVFRHDEKSGQMAVVYNELVQRIRLTARRVATGSAVRLRVHPRPWSEQELNDQDARLNELANEELGEEEAPQEAS